MINSNDCKFAEFDLVKMKASDVEFSTVYNLTFHRNDKCHGIVSWFDCIFSDVDYPVTLSTSPYKKATHWKQVSFYLEHPITVRKGDTLHGSIAVRKSKTNFRELDVKISYHYISKNNPKYSRDQVT